jgi:hypothetical protein
LKKKEHATLVILYFTASWFPDQVIMKNDSAMRVKLSSRCQPKDEHFSAGADEFNQVSSLC